jgi:recombination protein RecR
VGAIDELVAELAKLPGIGRKTAQRLTYHLLQQPRDRLTRLAGAIGEVAERVQSCPAVVERATGFRGHYVVLGGRLSPLEGVGPEQLRIGLLRRRIDSGEVHEVILATNPSLEGEATATFIQQQLAGSGVRVSRLARGLPVGGDLEYIDGVTLSHAMEARQEVS